MLVVLDQKIKKIISFVLRFSLVPYYMFMFYSILHYTVVYWVVL